MKKAIICILTVCLLCIVLCACGDSGISNENGNTSSDKTEKADVLVVYFSYSGNTERVAGYVANATGGTSVKITPQIPYTAADVNYNDSNSRSQVERRNNARPAISAMTYDSIDMADYATVFIGHPIWNGGEPMIIRTFIEHYGGLAGKSVFTFSTSASSGGSTAFNSISNLCPNANVKENRHFTSSGLAAAQQTVFAWIDGLNIDTSSENAGQEISKIYVSIGYNSLEVTLEKNSTTSR